MASRIAIYLLGRTFPAIAQSARMIGKEFDSSVSMRFMDMPLTRSYRKGRSQYDAEALLLELSRFASNDADKTVFLFHEDIFKEPLNFLFGLAYEDAAIVSTCRLDPRYYSKIEEGELRGAQTLYRERMLKEIMHECGHMFGLDHCKDKRCAMVFSESVADVDYKEAHLCASCRKAIKSVGDKSHYI